MDENQGMTQRELDVLSQFYEDALPKLGSDQLMAIVQDCESRIGSHVAGGCPDMAYVEKQRKIMSMVQDEFSRR